MILLIATILTATITVVGYEKESLYLKIGLLLLLFVFSFLEFRLAIHEGKLIYQLRFLSWALFTRVIPPNQITKIKFIRTGWVNKGAIVKTAKGCNLRIINFRPKNVTTELHQFTLENNILVEKSKDYLILERKKDKETFAPANIKQSQNDVYALHSFIIFILLMNTLVIEDFLSRIVMIFCLSFYFVGTILYIYSRKKAK
ncbi:hypothetical protein [Lysinibacillus sp. BW-2-10]|uniref:hypothetical protein n=1 Tax=Lysinibacillus sp. BW-2-10 TaxID=2590030 RepID=UPI00118086B9|nr:hypothetical protein [Lysinibacillus sp. BW-2-10]TSI03695.1 hypothetical protein FJQ64_15625 [Lysinibacillus sp. BW-2-10]